jgi:hypothetical protein
VYQSKITDYAFCSQAKPPGISLWSPKQGRSLHSETVPLPQALSSTAGPHHEALLSAGLSSHQSPSYIARPLTKGQSSVSSLLCLVCLSLGLFSLGLLQRLFFYSSSPKAEVLCLESLSDHDTHRSSSSSTSLGKFISPSEMSSRPPPGTLA